MNELTIEQLKSLESGEWVWIVPTNEALTPFYARIAKYENDDEDKFSFHSDGFRYYYHFSDYGKIWLAYKNKEQAERKDTDSLYQTAFDLILQDVYENRLQADTLSCSSCPFMFKIFDECENQGLYEDCKQRWKDYYIAEAERLWQH